MNNKILVIVMSIVALATAITGIFLGNSLMEKSYKLDTLTEKYSTIEDMKQPLTVEQALPYTPNDLHSLQLSEIDINFEKINEPNEDIPIIKKWEGDDILFIIPSNLLYDEFKWSPYTTIVGKDGIVAQYKTTQFIDLEEKDVSITCVDICEDKMILCSNGLFFEASLDGEVLYELGVKGLSHQITALENGNYLIVRSGHDQVCEITKDGDIAWQWNALEGIPQYTQDTYVSWDTVGANDIITNMFADYRQEFARHWEWTHVNSVQKLDNDNYFINLRNLDTIIEVNPSGEIVWSFGAFLIKHAHHPQILDNGNILIHDNGNGRHVEYTPRGEVVWEYTDIDSPIFGWTEKLSNGNYVVLDCFNGTILEVTPSNEILKEIEFPGKAIYGFSTCPANLFE